MVFSELASAASLSAVCGPVPETYDGVYVGDLLSRAMSHVQAGNVWITIMNNMNVIAVASLTEPAAIVLAEGVELIPEAREAAEAQGIAVYSTELTAYEICCCAARQSGES